MLFFNTKFSDAEYKKLQEEIAEHQSGKYSNVGFTYSQDEVVNENPDPQSEPSLDDELYKLPADLTVPKNIPLPKFQREHDIIEKTASFLATQNIQMEILLKTKQGKNEKFNFLNFGDPMNDYYKILKKAIANGIYKGT